MIVEGRVSKGGSILSCAGEPRAREVNPQGILGVEAGGKEVSGNQCLQEFLRTVTTSTVRGIASEVALGEDEGLPKACVANCDSLRMVPRSSLTRLAGQLAPERWVEAKRAMGAALGWRELTDLD